MERDNKMYIRVLAVGVSEKSNLIFAINTDRGIHFVAAAYNSKGFVSPKGSKQTYRNLAENLKCGRHRQQHKKAIAQRESRWLQDRNIVYLLVFGS